MLWKTIVSEAQMDSNIEHIKLMLQNHHRTKSSIMESAIINRLDKSLFTYDSELSMRVEYIKSKSELNVLRKL